MLESKKTTRYVFYVYLMLLTWGILFKFETNPEFIAFFLASRYINWIPFSEPLIVDGKIVFAEMLFNLISFIPLGVCVGLLTYQIFIRVFKSQTRKWVNILGMLSLGFAYLVLLLLHLIGV